MAGLFLVDQLGKLTALTQAPYDSEDLLQGLLADYPDLLGGDQMGDGVPRQWLFVAREAPVPDQDGGSGRWSVDHLFLDQDSIPTFVEVKRASDTRIRREVVGQMLDYAANGLLYWPVEAIQGFLVHDGLSADERLIEAFGPDVDVLAYWNRLRENITEGRVRLLFVADKIPSELLSVVEFLNSHMPEVDVLAVEVPQFTGEGLRTLAPRVLGQTQVAIQQKTGSRTSKKWDEASVFTLMQEKLSPAEVAFARRYFDWVVAQGWPIVYGRGKVDGSFTPSLSSGGRNFVYPLTCYTFGRCEFRFAWMMELSPFDQPELRMQFVQRLSLKPEYVIPDEAALTGKYPSVPFAAFTSDESFDALTDTILWYKAEVERATSLSAG